MTRKKILVTGVCGMIGSHLLDELMVKGHRVVGADNLTYGSLDNIRRHLKNPNFSFKKLDICNDKSLDRIGRADVIIHLAAVKKISEQDPALPTLRVNSDGTESVLRFARKAGAKVVVGSTSDVYGMSPKIPFGEEGECVLGSSTAKRWAYAVSKLFCEHLCMTYYKDFGVPVVVLRYFGGFSERSSRTWSGGHVPIFIDEISRNRPVTIHGDGQQTRSMAHVSDLVNGTLLAMENPRAVGEIINIGNDEEVSILESAKMIHRMLCPKKPLRIRWVPMKKIFGTYREIPRRVPDLRKAKRLLGYRPQISFREALERVVRARGALPTP